MAFTLYSLMQAALLCVNAIAVLHEERFLKNREKAGIEPRTGINEYRNEDTHTLWFLQLGNQIFMPAGSSCFMLYSETGLRDLAGEQTRESVDLERSQELNLN